MPYIGNLQGPTRESILASIPPRTLGCTQESVNEDIAFEEKETEKNAVIPACLDEDGSPFLEFMTAEGAPLRLPLLTPVLTGDILVLAPENGVAKVGVAEQVALHQWRLKVKPSAADSPLEAG